MYTVKSLSRFWREEPLRFFWKFDVTFPGERALPLELTANRPARREGD